MLQIFFMFVEKYNKQLSWTKILRTDTAFL